MICYGTNTIFLGKIFRLVSNGGKFNLVFEGANCPFEGFSKYKDGFFIRPISKDEINNAYYFNILAKYKGYSVQIEKFDDLHAVLVTSDKNIYSNLDFDLVDRGWYEKKVKISDLEKIWEERKPSELGFPYPEGLPEIEEIRI